jgi:hypothetical protein
MPQSLAKIYLHVIFSTKNREPLIADSWRDEPFHVLGGTINNLDCQSLIVDDPERIVHRRGIWPQSQIIFFYKTRNHFSRIPACSRPAICTCTNVSYASAILARPLFHNLVNAVHEIIGLAPLKNR